ncbi:DUF1492 domain-containing protein [Listeria ilorinensis]|uniref:DUF1492 domain-containing protein n=1 Tax=Listeria ilorinensis TaxID=2867439 RepID=UPI001EF402FB|nr:DUF1492 domain-containing protein [Listeria ilorinensis]
MKQLSLFKASNFEIDITSTRKNIWIEIEKYNYAKFIIQRNGRAIADLQATSISDMPGGGYKEYQSDVERAIVEAQHELEEARIYVKRFEEAVDAITNIRTNVPEIRNRRKEIFKLAFLKGYSKHRICEKLAIGETLFYDEEQEAVKQFSLNFDCYAIAHGSSKRKKSVWVGK